MHTDRPYILPNCSFHHTWKTSFTGACRPFFFFNGRQGGCKKYKLVFLSAMSDTAEVSDASDQPSWPPLYAVCSLILPGQNVFCTRALQDKMLSKYKVFGVFNARTHLSLMLLVHFLSYMCLLTSFQILCAAGVFDRWPRFAGVLSTRAFQRRLCRQDFADCWSRPPRGEILFMTACQPIIFHARSFNTERLTYRTASLRICPFTATYLSYPAHGSGVLSHPEGWSRSTVPRGWQNSWGAGRISMLCLKKNKTNT